MNPEVGMTPRKREGLQDVERWIAVQFPSATFEYHTCKRVSGHYVWNLRPAEDSAGESVRVMVSNQVLCSPDFREWALKTAALHYVPRVHRGAEQGVVVRSSGVEWWSRTPPTD